MSILKANGIIIDYDKKNKAQALELKKIIEQNPQFFTYLLSNYKGISFTNKKSYLNIPLDMDLSTSVISTIDSFFLQTTPKKTQEELSNWLLAYTIIEKTNHPSNYNIAKLPPNFSYYYIAYLRYQVDHSKEKLLSFIFNPTIAEENALFNWLCKRSGLSLYNNLLQKEILTLSNSKKPLDLFLVNNIEKITKIISDNFSAEEQEECHQNLPLQNLTKLKKEQCDELCMEYLATIDPTLKWLEIYITAQENGHIKYTSNNRKWETISNHDDISIVAPLSGTIEDFISMIHEFSHYISLINLNIGESIPLTLIEFPALFFEKTAYDFLLSKNYPQDEIALLQEQRDSWTQENYLSVLPYLNYLSGYLKNDFKLNEYEVKNWHEVQDDYIEDQDECLNRNSFLITKHDAITKQYPYVIGSYLAQTALRKQNAAPDTLKDIIYYTENLSKTSPEEIFTYLSILSFPKEKRNILIK
ncbi:MAG: hypothetical protein PUC82_02305 [bacterium]|nr:hypothetical protein [bacterium]